MRTFLAGFVALAAFAQTYDVRIVNARIVDGAGTPWFAGDIAISGDRIERIGHVEGTAQLEIDAAGAVAAPGFIDIHNHGRRGIFDRPAAENWIRQGVTTLIEGPDGSSPLPVAPFLDRLAGTRPAVNMGLFVGHGSIRQQVVGLANRKAAPEELERMKTLAAQAMRDGAFGLSTGLFYVPGNFAPADEVIEIAKVVGRLGGMHVSHMRNESAHVLDSVRETIRIGEEGRLPTQITHHKIIGRASRGASKETLRLVEEARARGVDVTIDQYPYTASSTGISGLIPQWALEGGQRSFLERLDNPRQRARIQAEVVTNLKLDRGAGDPKNVVIANCSFDRTLAGKSLADLAPGKGFEGAAEAAIELQRKGGCSAVYHAIAEEDVVRIMQSPFTMIASDGEIPVFGEGAPHPRSYGTFARVLGEYVRRRHVLLLEEAVRKMTGFPAARLKLADRGLLRPGMKADVVIFDPAAIADRATFESPHQYADGVSWVLVNGKPVLAKGKMTGVRPGAVLYGPAHGQRVLAGLGEQAGREARAVRAERPPGALWPVLFICPPCEKSGTFTAQILVCPIRMANEHESRGL